MALISLRQLLDHAAENDYGVPVEEIQEGIKHGVRKVNIDTDLRLASTGAVRRFLAENRSDSPKNSLKVGGDYNKYYYERTDIVQAW